MIPVEQLVMLGGALTLLVAALQIEGGADATVPGTEAVSNLVFLMADLEQIQAQAEADARAYMGLGDPNGPVGEALERVSGTPPMPAAPYLKLLFEMESAAP